MTTTATRVKNYRRLEKERQKVLTELNTPAAKEDSGYRETLQRKLEEIRDEVGYWRECP